MKTILPLLLLAFSLSAESAEREKACTPEQARLIRSFKYRAAVETDKLIVKVRNATARKDITWNEWRRLHVTGNILHCARRKLGTLNWVCADGVPEGLAARTYPVISNKVYIDDYAFREPKPKYQEALFLHEATHHCGTNDARYFDHGARPESSRFVGWQVIADTYSYWVENGFCIPERDC